MSRKNSEFETTRVVEEPADTAAPIEAAKERHLSVKVAPALFSRVQMHAHATGRTASEVVADLIDAGVPVYEAKAKN